MNKAVLALVCTSTFGLSGCIGLIGAGIGAARESGKGERAEKEQFKELVKKHEEFEAKLATLPEDLDELEEVYKEWEQLYTAIEYYRAAEEFDYKKVGSCYKSKARAKSDHCKKAKDMAGKVERKMAETLHAAMDAEPAVGRKFPLWNIAYAQKHPGLAEAVDVAASIEKYTAKLSEHAAKRIRKAGGAESLAKKGNFGHCFFSEREAGDDIKPKFNISGNAENLHIRCVATDALASFDRTEKDVVSVEFVAQGGRANMAPLPGDSSSSSPTYTNEMEMAALRKAIKKSRGDRREDKAAADVKPWRFAIVEVEYVTSNKVGENARRVGDEIRIDDQIQSTAIAQGMLVIDLEAPDDAEVADGDDADRDRDASGDDDAEEAPKSKKKATKVAKKAGKKKGKKARRR